MADTCTRDPAPRDGWYTLVVALDDDRPFACAGPIYLKAGEVPALRDWRSSEPITEWRGKALPVPDEERGE